jgi:hypothetical protein
VIDWLYGIGDKLGDVDTLAFTLALDIDYTVNSVSLYWPVPADFLGNSSIKPNGLLGSDAYPQVKWYVRFPSTQPPDLRDGVIDFSPGSGFPNFRTVGSLAYQVIKR